MQSPALLFEDLLRLRRAAPEQTAGFVQLSHDAVCAKVQAQIELMLDSFSKYQNISHVVQGPRDQGVDVLLRGSLPDEPEKYVGIQVKSFKEIADKQSDLSKLLKAAYFDAKSTYGDQLTRYYILLCGDARVHKLRLGAIANEFSKEARCRVVHPREILAFIEMPAETIYAFVDRHLSDEDFVRKQAREEVEDLSKSRLYFLLTCLCYALSHSTDLLPSDFFQQDDRILRMSSRFRKSTPEKAFGYFEDSAIQLDFGTSTTRIRVEDYPAIRALYFDLQVRYDADDEQLFEHLLEFLSLP